jgi:hypothetical protein
MTVNRAGRVIIGLLASISVALGAPSSPIYVSSSSLWLTVFAGVSQFQSGLTKLCLIDTGLRRPGLPGADIRLL